MINKNLIKKIEKKKKLSIIGRGNTAIFYKHDKNVVTIGINIAKINNTYLDYCYKKKKLIPTGRRLRVGSTFFYLYEILYFINKKINKKIDVYLHGFDFRKFSANDDVEKKKINKNSLQQKIDVNSQMIAFDNIKNSFKNLSIHRAGFDINSDFNPSRGNTKNNTKNNSKITIVAELTTNHLGKTSLLKKLMNGCIQAGVKTIKFQKRDVENFYNKQKLDSIYKTPISKTFREYRNNLELSEEQLEIIKKYKKKYNLKIIFSILDFKSYKILKKKGFKNFKIPSTISRHVNFIKKISKENLDEIIISTGMTDEKYLKLIISKFKKFKKIYLLHAISSYPAHYDILNLNIIKRYENLSRKYKNIVPGYSSHDIGETGSIMAIAAGAKMIEKHVKFGVNNWMHFDYTAIDVFEELPFFVKSINRANTIMGNEKKVVYSDEFHKYIPNTEGKK